MSFLISYGFVGGEYRSIGIPSRLQRNLVKFHLMELPMIPPILALKKLYKGSAFLPLTYIFSKIGNVAPLASTNCLISALVLGS